MDSSQTTILFFLDRFFLSAEALEQIVVQTIIKSHSDSWVIFLLSIDDSDLVTRKYVSLQE